MINRGGKTTCSLFLFEYLEGKFVWNLEKTNDEFLKWCASLCNIYAIFMQYSCNLMQIQTIEPWWNTEALPPVFQKGTIQEHYRTLYVTYALIFLWACQCAKKSDPLWKSLWKSLWSSQIFCELLKSSWGSVDSGKVLVLYSKRREKEAEEAIRCHWPVKWWPALVSASVSPFYLWHLEVLDFGNQ